MSALMTSASPTLALPTHKCPRCAGLGHIPDSLATGQNMRLARARANLSLREVARRLNWSPAYVFDLELGHRNWTEWRIYLYNKALAQ